METPVLLVRVACVGFCVCFQSGGGVRDDRMTSGFMGNYLVEGRSSVSRQKGVNFHRLLAISLVCLNSLDLLV